MSLQLSGKKIILAITGSIAAYKTPDLVRLLIKNGAEVRVIMTPAAGQFVSQLALATVSRNPVFSEIHDGISWNNHVALGRWSDALVVAPCTANTVARMAHGICDSMVGAVYLSAVCPVFIAPAMDEDMWLHQSTKHNLEKLASYGNHLIPVGYGELASGLTGSGRMAEPEEIIACLIRFFSGNDKLPLSGTKALVTAGPTYEAIDPVRFIGNFSSGKMGIAIAEALADQGAAVSLVLGPTHLTTLHSGIQLTRVQDSREMYETCVGIFPEMDLTVMAAAVADYTPEQKATGKIKKQEATLSLHLVKTRDILATLGTMKKQGQILVGFALETDNETHNALRKLQEKNADLIVLNSLRDEGAGFGFDTNKVTLLDASGRGNELPLQSKKDTAEAIIHHIIGLRHAEKIL